MSLPLVLLLTTEVPLAEALQTELGQRFEFDFCPTVDEARPVMQQTPPWGLVADFRMPSKGGHAEAAFLDLVTSQRPDLRLTILAPLSAPEPLERSLTCAGVTVLRTPVNTTDLVTRLSEQSPVKVEPKQVTVRVTHEAEYTLTGLTRRFETNTPRFNNLSASTGS